MKKNFYGKIIGRATKGEMTLSKKKQPTFQKDSSQEGRDVAFMDVDRMINEGMSGGAVHMRHDSTNIEEARELHEEEPPQQTE
jgi:hypothetical protein